MTEKIVSKLNELSTVKQALDVSRLDYDEKRRKILEVVQEQLDELDAEYKPMFASAEARAEELQSEIKALVLEHGATVSGEYMQAVYSKGRDGGFDTKALMGYAAAHHEILAFKKPSGEPSVSFRDNK